MKLFQTTFSFDEVLALRPGKDNALSHELIDLAWHRWHSEQPKAFKKHEENAYGTIAVGATGYTVTIQPDTTCVRDIYQLYGRYLERS